MREQFAGPEDIDGSTGAGNFNTDVCPGGVHWCWRNGQRYKSCCRCRKVAFGGPAPFLNQIGVEVMALCNRSDGGIGFEGLSQDPCLELSGVPATTLRGYPYLPE